MKDLNKNNISIESVKQLIKGHELKYIETSIEITEEQRLVDENCYDFEQFPEDIQTKATEEYPKFQANHEYLDAPETDKEIIKPLMILSNIDNKKNEVKVKTWKMEYHNRVISKLKEIKESLELDMNFFQKLLSK